MIKIILLLVLLVSALCSLTGFNAAHAYTTQTPEISGYNSRTMRLTGGSGGYSGGTYSRTGTVNINGKTVPIPGSLKPSLTMGSIVKNALKLNPYKIAGTLAAGWLIDQGLQWMEDQQQWQKKQATDGEYYFGKTWANGYGPSGPGGINNCQSSDPVGCTAETAAKEAHKVLRGEAVNAVIQLSQTATSGVYRVQFIQASTGNTLFNDITVTPHTSLNRPGF